MLHIWLRSEIVGAYLLCVESTFCANTCFCKGYLCQLYVACMGWLDVLCRLLSCSWSWAENNMGLHAVLIRSSIMELCW